MAGAPDAAGGAVVRVPGEIRNRVIDALERAESPPPLHQVRPETRVAIERDYRAMREHLRALSSWIRTLDTPDHTP